MMRQKTLSKILVLLAVLVMALHVVPGAFASEDEGDDAGDDSPDEEVDDDSPDDEAEDVDDDSEDDSPDTNETEDETEIEVEIEHGAAQVEARVGEATYRFVVNSTDQTAILKEIAAKTGLTLSEVTAITQFETGSEEPEDDDSWDLSSDFEDERDDSPDTAETEDEIEGFREGVYVEQAIASQGEGNRDETADDSTEEIEVEDIRHEESFWARFMTWLGLA